MSAELEKRMLNHEDNLIERKPESVNRSDIRKALCAFSNSLIQNQTALLVIGISDQGKPIGVNNTDKVQKSIHEAAQKCYPPIINIKIHVVDLENKKIIVTEISKSDNTPHFTGQAYIRVGSQSIPASDAQFKTLIDKRITKCGWLNERIEKVVSVHLIGRQLGSNTSAGNYRGFTEATIRKCDNHLVALYFFSQGRNWTVSLEDVRPGYDDEKHRDLIEIR
jgi:hypothetical protein